MSYHVRLEPVRPIAAQAEYVSILNSSSALLSIHLGVLVYPVAVELLYSVVLDRLARST